MTSFSRRQDGSVAVLFAIVLVPMIIAGIFALDYARFLTMKSELVSAMDAAMLEGVQTANRAYQNGESKGQAKQIGEAAASTYFAALTANHPSFDLNDFDPKVQFNNDTVTGTGRYEDASVETMIAKMIGTDALETQFSNEVTIAMDQHVEIHFIIDASASMGVGATQDDMSALEADYRINCAFACHSPDIETHTLAREINATLRIDVIKEAIRPLIEAAQASGVKNVSFAIHTFSNTLNTIVNPSDDFAALLVSLDEVDLIGDYGETGTSFDYVLEQASNAIGLSGDGGQNSPRKTAIILTDGIATNTMYFDDNGKLDTMADPNFVRFAPTRNGNGEWSMQGFNPAACDPLKDNNVDIYTVNTEYLIPQNETEIRFLWIEESLKDGVVGNLEACASSSDQFYYASAPDEITSAISTLFEAATRDSLRVSK